VVLTRGHRSGAAVAARTVQRTVPTWFVSPLISILPRHWIAGSLSRFGRIQIGLDGGICFHLGMATAPVSLSRITHYCDRILRTSAIIDYDGAVNGLQVENKGRIRRMAATVDASLATVRMALEARADLLLVHHGLFWGPTHPWTGKRRELVGLLVEGNLAVYSSHLPLDLHPRLGNNAGLCKALELKNLKPFFPCKGQSIGLMARASLPREALAARLADVVGFTPTLLPGGPAICQKIGVVTGGAGAEMKLAAEAGVDTFITGEGPHWTYALAEELGLNVFYAGHYATETFGVKALARHLSEHFKVPWMFLDHPTGL